MLEDCFTLRSIEARIAQQLAVVTLLGQLPLTPQDSRHLSQILKAEIKQDWSQFQQCGSLSFCAYLVQAGIQHYDHGDYWSAVQGELGQFAGHWKQRWGELFVATLQKYRLTTFPATGGHKFVTPILLHGGIPDHCLENFFLHVLTPIISDKLDVDINDPEQLVAEWRATAEYQYANKPVRRFLEEGGKPAADLLSRCLEMLRAATYEQQIPTADELGLPVRVVQRFAQWWQRAAQQPLLAEQRIRLNRPGIERDFYGEVHCVLPEQTLPNNDDEVIVWQVKADEKIIHTEDLIIYATGNSLLSEPTECSLPPARRYVVRLLRQGKLVRAWSFDGLTENNWMAFDEKGRLRRSNCLPRAPFWLVFAAELDLLETALRVIEVAPPETIADSRWARYSHYLIDPLEAAELTLKDEHDTDLEVPLANDREPLLSGTPLRDCHVREMPVYTDQLPALHLPMTRAEEVSLWDVIIEDLSSQSPTRSWHTLKELTYERKPGWAIVPLSQAALLGQPLLGEYRVKVRSRGALGRDQQFQFAYVHDLNYEFDRSFYLLHEVPRLTLLANPAIAISAADVGTRITQEAELTLAQFEVNVRVNTLYLLAAGRQSLPLTIQIPRLRWTLHGLANHQALGWLSESIIAQREDFEASPELTLMVKLPVADGAECTVILEGSNQQTNVKVRRGEMHLALTPFHDSLRRLTAPVVRFAVCFTDAAGQEQKVYPLRIRTRWMVDKFECRETRCVSFTGQAQRQPRIERTISFLLADNGRVQQRQMRLWNLLQPWEVPVKISLPDDATVLEICEPLAALVPSRYRVELFTEGEFETTIPLFPPAAHLPGTYDIVIDEAVVMRQSYAAAKTFRDHLSRRLEGNRRQFDLSRYAFQATDTDDLMRALMVLICESKTEEIKQLWFDDLHQQIRQEFLRKEMRRCLERYAAGQEDQTRSELLQLCKLIGLAVNSLLPHRSYTEVRFENRVVTYLGVVNWEFEKRQHPGNEHPEDLLSLSLNSRKIPLSRLDEIQPVVTATNHR